MKQTGSVTVRGVEIGSGIPKICVTVMGKTEPEVLASAEARRQRRSTRPAAQIAGLL